jgi:hypothetical protein
MVVLERTGNSQFHTYSTVDAILPDIFEADHVSFLRFRCIFYTSQTSSFPRFRCILDAHPKLAQA